MTAADRFTFTDALDEKADYIAQRLVRCWLDGKGSICDELALYSNHLLLYDSNPSRTAPAKLLFGGKSTKAVEAFGRDWLQKKPTQVFTAEYLELSAATHRDALDGNIPVFEARSVTNTLVSGGPPAIYKSLILPFRADGGATFLLTYSFDLLPLEPQVAHEAIERHRFHHSLRNKDPRSSGFQAH